MAELASEARVSVGQIYRFFDGKEDVIAAIVRIDVDERLRKIEEIRGKFRSKIFGIDRFLDLAIALANTENDCQMIYHILAEARRNEVITSILSELCVGYRSLSRDVALGINANLSGAGLDGAEELIMSCIFGAGHLSYAKVSAKDGLMARHGVRLIVQAVASAT